MENRKKKIATVVACWLIVIVAIALMISVTSTYLSMKNSFETQAIEIATRHVEDASTDTLETAENVVLGVMEQLVAVLDSPTGDSANQQDTQPQDISFDHGIGVEVHIINHDGIVEDSTHPDSVGLDIHSSKLFTELIQEKGTDLIIWDREPEFVMNPGSDQVQCVGKRLPDDQGFIVVSLTDEAFSRLVMKQARHTVTNRRIGENGYLLVCGPDLEIVDSFHHTYTGQDVTDTGITIDPEKEYALTSFKADIFGVPSYVVINRNNGIYVIGVSPVSDTVSDLNLMVRVTVLQEIIVFTILLLALGIMIRHKVVNNIVGVTTVLNRITEGNLEERVEIRDTCEFDELSNDINAMVGRLKGYIQEAEARIDADLTLAKAIQTSALPGRFPAFPEHREFDLFASMNAAKEVGGDFYDFFMLNHHTLGFLIADVSGKSIPGALFMMTAKTEIRNLAERELSPAEVFETANNMLCQGNDADMFVTAWMGYLDLETGLVRVVNAGHNPPLLISGGKAEYVILKPGLMLAGMEDMQYTEQTVQMRKGDLLYLYTDGVTEAMDQQGRLYGEERLKEQLSFGDRVPDAFADQSVARAVCRMVLADVEAFSAGVEQSDDITMLCIRYLGGQNEGNNGSGDS